MIRYILLFLFTFNITYAVELIGDFKQGSFILGKTSPQSKVLIDNRKVRVSKDGYFAFGLDRDRKNNVIIKIINKKETKLEYINHYVSFHTETERNRKDFLF